MCAGWVDAVLLVGLNGIVGLLGIGPVVLLVRDRLFGRNDERYYLCCPIDLNAIFNAKPMLYVTYY